MTNVSGNPTRWLGTSPGGFSIVGNTITLETVELLRSRGYKFVEIEASERRTLACNVLSLGRRRLLALQENDGTNDRLRRAGFEVRTFPGRELGINGSGGPTCLTRALLRS